MSDPKHFDQQTYLVGIQNIPIRKDITFGNGPGSDIQK